VILNGGEQATEREKEKERKRENGAFLRCGLIAQHHVSCVFRHLISFPAPAPFPQPRLSSFLITVDKDQGQGG